ncbi:hypothetical protein J6590_068916 [Homalodisca vitripennis]|nr:hypothetical protein J6590_068916 [Homalodisca vitripennis]
MSIQHLEHMVYKGELVYLYRLKDGDVQSSFALQVAQAQGLAKSSADRATMTTVVRTVAPQLLHKATDYNRREEEVLFSSKMT